MLSAKLAKLLPIGVLLLAFGLRFYMLGAQSLWNDEGNSLRLAQRPVADLIVAAANDIHPPGYYLLLKGWIDLAGDSEFALRALSALAGVLTVACVYALGQALFSRGAGLVAAALVAVNSFSVYYGQEARMYALLALWTAAGLWLFVRWTARPDRLTAVGLALINAAGLYTHYFYPLVMITQGLMFVALQIKQRNCKQFRDYVLLNVLTLILFVPLAPTALHQVGGWPHTGQPIDTLSGVAIIARWLIYGNTSLTTGWWTYAWPALFIVAAFLPDWLSRRQPFAWRIALPWVLIVVLCGTMFALNLFRDANLKFLLPAEIGMALLIGRGAWLLWEIGSPNLVVPLEAAPRWLAVFGMIIFAGFAQESLNNLYYSLTFARDDYRAIAQTIASDSNPNVRVILDAPNQIEAFSYYYHGPAPTVGLPPGLGGNDQETRQELDQTLKGASHIYVIWWGQDERDPNHVVASSLNSEAFAVSQRWYGNVQLALYTLADSSTLQPLVLDPADFGGLIRLQSAAVTSQTVCAGDALGAALTWQAEKPIGTRYKVFVQLLDGNGQLVAQHDSEPVNDTSLTVNWSPGQTIVDRHGLAIAANLPPGAYHLIAGLYDINPPNARLPVGSSDHVELGTIMVNACPRG